MSLRYVVSIGQSFEGGGETMQTKALRLLMGSAVLFVGCTTANPTKEDHTAAIDEPLYGETDIIEEEEADDFVPETPSGIPFLELSLEGKIDEFLDAPNSVFGENIAGEMGLSGDRRWAPWLLDLMRLGGSTGTQRSTARALQTLSGLAANNHPIDDLVMYGTWADRKSTRLNSSHSQQSRMPSSA